MMTTDHPQTDDGRLREEAAAWFVRLQAEEVSDEDQSQFEQWLQQNPAHKYAYEKTAALWDSMEAVRAPILAKVGSSLPPRQQKRWVELRTVWALAAAIMAAVMAAWLLLPESPSATPYMTAAAERRTITLEDGSVLSLSARTEILVRFDDRDRVIDLKRGEVFATVRKDASRPFRIVTDDVVATAIGTQFNLRDYDLATTVAVSEGMVRVALTKPTGPKVERDLSAGQEVSYKPSHGFSDINTVNPLHVAAWRYGRMIYDQAALATVIEDINNYFGSQIEIADSATAALRVSGVLDMTTERRLLDALTEVLPIKVTSRGSQTIVLTDQDRIRTSDG